MLKIILSKQNILTKIATASRSCNTNSELQFNNVETEKILKVVNNINLEELVDRFEISKSRAQKLHLVRQRSGDLQSIGQILHIDGFGLKVLNKFCQSILNENERRDQMKKPVNRKRSYTLSPIPDEVISHINSFTAIHIEVTAVSWTTFNLIPMEKTQITHWKCIHLPESKLNLYNLAAFMSQTLKDLPKCDFHIFETPFTQNSGQASKANMNIKINQMLGMASVVAAERNTLPNHLDDGEEFKLLNVAFLRRYLYARLFKLYVGTERTSTTNLVKNLIQLTNDSPEMEDIRTMVSVCPSLKSMYLSADRQEEDLLGCSLLLGLAFLRLSILKCPLIVLTGHDMICKRPISRLRDHSELNHQSDHS